MFEMAEDYKISSTEKLQLMEKELAVQLVELKTEIEENGVLQGTPARSYSSVPIPKDISYFRKERELILRKGLQVAEARPVAAQADVMERELESCLRQEYTPESLPLLLHQFYTDRISQLVQFKYLCMLRWRRFCQHSGIIEQLYPLYKKQLEYIMKEYDDTVQRARRLSVARESFLTEKGMPVNAVTQEDLVIYLQWLVCHLQSVKTIHNYLRVLQYLPVSERMEVSSTRSSDGVQDPGDTISLSDSLSSFLRSPARPSTAVSSLSGSAGKTLSASPLQSGLHIMVSSISSHTVMTNIEGLYRSEVTALLPVQQLELKEFKPQLQYLISHFQIDYNTEDLRNTANEMELFTLVARKFRLIFKKQQTMKTFPIYGATESGTDQWGMKKPSMALKKQANWIPFIKITAKHDPWQQKMITKLKQDRSVDELLHLHSKFFQVSDPDRLMEALKEHAATVFEPEPIQPLSVTSHPTGQHTNQIWKRIYSSPDLFQAPIPEESSQPESNEQESESVNQSKRPGSQKKKKEEGYCYMDTMQLLGLDEGKEENIKDPVMMRGAYLSFLYLRHLRIRELQRICLGFLNYFRSVERTLTFSIAGLSLDGMKLTKTAEDSCWVNAARGGSGTAGGLGSHQYLHNTPADYKVHSAEFMEFPEVENYDDFYTTEDSYIHTQDQRGVYIMYDEAVKDLQELENVLLLVASQYIEKDKGHKANRQSHSSACLQAPGTNLNFWAHVDVDRFAVLLELWTCEVAFLKNKQQLLDCYFEAYQHVLDHEERFALAQVITDIMHKRPRLEISSQYFVTAYEEECVCLQYHQQLIRDILNKQIDEQRQYVQRVWRDGQKGNVYEFGLPPNYTPKQLIAINNNSSALRNVFLLEFHPSLGLASRIPQALNQAYSELCQLRRPQSVQESVALEKQLLQLAVEKWQALEPPGASYSTPVQKDLFSGIFFEDPFFVRDVGFSALEFAEEGEKKQGREKQAFIVETFSRLLELITLRHRLIESASETSQLAQLYRTFSAEMGFNEFHLYLRPVQFEFAAHREKADQPPPVFITALLEDDSQVDRYTPSSLLLGIQEIDENQIGKFSFRTQEAVLQLLSTSGIENMQVVLACQVTQKNALIGAVKQASLCHQAQQLSQKVDDTQVQRGSAGSWSRGSSATGPNSLAAKELESQFTAPGISSISARPKLGAGARRRPPEAFVSIQLEKAGPRDVMLNTFISKKQAMGTIMKSPEEAQKVKRGLILEFCQKFCHRMCQYSLRGQIIEYYNSLAALLEDIPSIRDTYFMLGQPHERKGERDSEEGLNSDPRCFQRRPRCLLSGDGESFLNLWFIPHFSEVLIMFKSLEENTCHRSLQQTLQIVGALHDIVSYLVSFARLGNYSAISRSRKPKQLTADWGGTEGIGAELQEIQKQIDDLCDPASPQEVGKLLHLRRDILFLQFDTGVRHLIREAFLAAGNKEAYQTVTDNMYHALPALSTSLVSSVCSSQITVPQPLDPISVRAQRLFPWRSFQAGHGAFPLSICNIQPIEYNMQLCLSGLNDRNRNVANGEILGVSLLMEDVLQSSQDMINFSLQGWEEDNNSKVTEMQLAISGVAELEDQLSPVEGKVSSFQALLQDHIEVYTLLRAFLVLWKQLEVFKAEWGRQRLCVEDINTVSLYKQFSKIYRVEILYPTMKVIARQLGKEDKFEGLVSDTQPILLPKGASEVETKTHQLHKLLESLEGHMIHAVQKKISKELTLVISERARQDTGLPAELWKHPVMKESFSAVRPQIVESFLQTLLERCEENKDKLTFTKDHLEACLTSLACDVMARERSNFETYSMFYENILQQEHQLLYQKEQDLKTLEESKTQCEGLEGQTADLSHEMIVEITALRAKLSNLEEEKQSLREEVRKEVQHEYEELVRSMFVACYHLQVKLDEYHVRMNQDVSDLVTEVRREGVENIIKLKKKYGSTKDDEALKGTLARQEELQALRGENSRLEGLLCKLKSLGCWRQTVKQGQLRKQLRQHQQEAVLHKKECLAVKMVAEEEEILLQQELEAVRQALSKCQKEYMTIKKQLGKQRQLLKESEHRAAEETRSRQHLDSMKAANLWRLLEDVEEKEKQLQVLTGELENNSKTTQLQNQKTDKEIRQVKSQLSLERSLKQDAFQRVDELQSQVYDIEATLSQRNSSAGVIKKPLMSRRASSITSIRPGSASWNLLSTHSAFVLSRDYQQPSPTLDRKAVNSIGTTGKDTRLQRPKTVPIRLGNKVAEALLPDLEEVNPHRLITQLQDLRLSKK